MDFIIGGHTAVEMKTKVNVSPPDTRSRRARAEEKRRWCYLCMRLEPRPCRADGVEILRGRQAPKSFDDSEENQEDPTEPKPLWIENSSGRWSAWLVLVRRGVVAAR